ncbi:hypothetical protein LPJ78_002853 [Coemansia sp. RSA 989]|nr:hypothetical protein BX667DRAFT_525299 [Coemansia mojavensis]KAJ1742222.1 hypothetical protein LPJ68_002077 [Coemansia sp. RSA 1086]KAJ1750569.1 hypothetical protein LPJ79_002766 [Coemansia sp. RSA 1821]KAJ1865159.1 hypothetical protein LPJ78_002853 [Coemansia sp. RSA 989]KAJ1872488.1 hypothetical protein LPJ55_003024 [Coemansia sp. RSA 990]KAJ2677227.1 hypothetical protein IWW42_000032 [Coemansia sp. RSA 1085]
MSIQVLVLGRGFVGEYLEDILEDKSVAATTTDGRENTIKWKFSTDTPLDFGVLPAATSSVVITFPVQGEAAMRQLVDGYLAYHCSLDPGYKSPRWIYLGSSRAFKEVPSTRFTKPDLDAGGLRTFAEECLINEYGGCVLNLVGLWGGKRVPSEWSRFYTSKDKLRNRLNDRSLHLIHGADAARAIRACICYKGELPAGRWLVSDDRVYDMLQIMIGAEHIRMYLEELWQDEQVQALLNARTVDEVRLGPSEVTKRIESLHFWSHFGIQPQYFYTIN